MEHEEVDRPDAAEMTAVLLTRDELLGLVKDWSRRVLGIRVMWIFDGCTSGSASRELAFLNRRLDCAARSLV